MSVFPGSKISGGSTYPSSSEEGLADFQIDLAGKDLTVEVSLSGYKLTFINAGSEFTPTPAISFMVNFDPSREDNAKDSLDQMWGRLIDGGEALMPLQEYPFSKHYGWVKDKHGFTWQLILTNPEGEERPFIIPALQFSKQSQNKAAEAIDFYTNLFSHSRIGEQYPYGQAMGPATAESLMFADFQLEGQWFVANDSAVEHDFTFNEAISLEVLCKDQAEIDKLWGSLSAVSESEQCGWCKDKYGVSWQIIPENMGELMKKPGAYKVLMNQRKIVISEY